MSDNIIYFTLDFENDLGSALKDKTYYSIDHIEELIKILSHYNIPLTAFCEGEIIEKLPYKIEPLINIQAEIELHGYNHDSAFASLENKVDNLMHGLDAYSSHFGNMPNGYRAPNGMINYDELTILNNNQIKYDSSIFPSYFPGRFNNSKYPKVPFGYKELDIIELPFSVTQGFIAIPISLSYIQLLGKSIFSFIANKNQLPNRIVFDFHMHDIIEGIYYDKGNSYFERFGYSIINMKNKKKYFEDIINWLFSLGYKPKYLSELYSESVLDKDLLLI